MRRRRGHERGCPNNKRAPIKQIFDCNRMAPRFRKASDPLAIVIEKPGRRRRISALNRWCLRFENACRQRLSYRRVSKFHCKPTDIG
jgi:hypothetical protein